MSPSYSGKLLMIALVIHPRSGINTRRHTHTFICVLFSLRRTFVRTYVYRVDDIRTRMEICPRLRFARTKATSTKCSRDSLNFCVSRRVAEGNVRRPVILCYWTISLSSLSSVFTDPYHAPLHCTWLWSRAVTSAYLRYFSKESLFLTLWKNIARYRL